jgi:photosystem II Psb27 protein
MPTDDSRKISNLAAQPELLHRKMMILALSLVSSAAAFGPWAGPMHVIDRTASAVQMSAADGPMTRRGVVAGAFAAFVGVLPSFAEDDYKLKKDYPTDARTLLKNMELATELARGAPNMETIVKSTRSEMNDFVAFYRRQPKVAGMPSFSTLYTAVNTLSGHYASYGNKYPVPEKRKVSRRARSLARGVSRVRLAPTRHRCSRSLSLYA